MRPWCLQIKFNNIFNERNNVLFSMCFEYNHKKKIMLQIISSSKELIENMT